MVTSNDCYAKYGAPTANNPHLTMFIVPVHLWIQSMPKKIYCNMDLIVPLTHALENVRDAFLQLQLKTWDGCFNIRQMRGLQSMSLHSWAIAIDINAFENQLGQEPKMPPEFVKCFTDAGFDWGGKWKRKDGMHFQLSKI